MDYFGAELYLVYFSTGILLRYLVGALSGERLFHLFGLAGILLIGLQSFSLADTYLSIQGYYVILLMSAVITLIYVKQASLRPFISANSLSERFGRVSYGLYAFSGLILTLFRFLFGHQLGVFSILLSLFTLLLIAMLSYRFIERPIYLFVKKKVG